MNKQILSHQHTCDKCETVYQHAHRAKSAEHKQFANQCINPECEWYQGEGPPKNVWSYSLDVEIPHADQPKSTKPTKDSEDALLKNIRIRYNAGELKCNRREHYKLEKLPTDKYSKAKRKSNLEIIEQMTPFKTATCDCERDACKAMWGSRTIGTHQTRYVCNGNLHVGIGKIDPTKAPKKVCPLNYSLDQSQFDTLIKLFPDWIFDTSSGTHDHPIAHTTTMLRTYEIMHSFPRGHNIIDMHGNPAANSKYPNLNITTVVELASPKDYIRQATKWSGHNYSIGTLESLPELECFAETQTITSFHTLYYYKPSTIRDVLKSKQGLTMTALIHKLDKTSINGDEQSLFYHDGMVLQRNKLTNESYSHEDTSFWFNNQTWCDSDDTGLAWTISGNADTYTITIVACPKAVMLGDRTSQLKEEEQRQRQAKAHIEQVVTINDEQMLLPIKPEHKDLHDELRKRASGRDRTEKTFRTHNNTAQYRAKSIMTDKGIDISADDLYAVTVSSFWYDWERDQKLQTLVAEPELSKGHQMLLSTCDYFTSRNFIKDTLTILGAYAASKDTKLVKRDLGIKLVAALMTCTNRK